MQSVLLLWQVMCALLLADLGSEGAGPGLCKMWHPVPQEVCGQLPQSRCLQVRTRTPTAASTEPSSHTHTHYTCVRRGIELQSHDVQGFTVYEDAGQEEGDGETGRGECEWAEHRRHRQSSGEESLTQ